MSETLEYNYSYDGEYDNGTFTIGGLFSSGELLIYDDALTGDNDNIAEPNEELDIDGYPDPETYIGYADDGGIVTQVGLDGYFFNTNVSTYENGDKISITAGDLPFCFTRGTRILTPDGERAVETLCIGDGVLNTDGATVTVKWIGRQQRHPRFAKLMNQLPVRLQAGALGHDQPTRDLYVSPDHALLVDGCLVQAAALINGRTITQMTDWDGDLEYFHIETDAHELILAEGAPAETFIDNVSRETFDNYAEYQVLYPDAAPMVELDLPRVKYARQLPRAISRRLEAVADSLNGEAARAA